MKRPASPERVASLGGENKSAREKPPAKREARKGAEGRSILGSGPPSAQHQDGVLSLGGSARAEADQSGD